MGFKFFEGFVRECCSFTETNFVPDKTREAKSAPASAHLISSPARIKESRPCEPKRRMYKKPCRDVFRSVVAPSADFGLERTSPFSLLLSCRSAHRTMPRLVLLHRHRRPASDLFEFGAESSIELELGCGRGRAADSVDVDVTVHLQLRGC